MEIHALDQWIRLIHALSLRRDAAFSESKHYIR